MQKVDLPAPFHRYRDINGVLEFGAFANAEPDRETALVAISEVVPDVNRDALRVLGCRTIDDQTFYGDWYDAKTGALIKKGSGTTADGRRIVDPLLCDIDRLGIVSGGWQIPEVGAGGQFAYAFSSTVYGLRGPRAAVQQLFHEVVDFILPAGFTHEIQDWSSPRLVEASPYFEAGADWWGVFLFTIYVHDLRRLTVIAGSDTD